MKVEVEEKDLSSVVEDVLTSLLGLEMNQRESGNDQLDMAQRLIGFVTFTGARDGALFLDCPFELASHAASIMFEIDSEELEINETKDALGEIVNMLAGNLKNHLPSPCQLSLPAVAGGREFNVIIPDTKVATSVAFDCGEHSFVVTLMLGN